jgi:hypothetical protein
MNPAKLLRPISRIAIALLLLSISGVASNAGAQTWVPTGSMATPRLDHTATLLPNGKVLIIGGCGNSGPNPFTSSAELYDPATGTFSLTGSMTTARCRHTATLLPNGKVLIAGGSVFTDNQLANAELYDPATGTFTPTGSMANAREAHTATLLENGKVLIAGGDVGPFCQTPLSSAELYDPATGTFAPTGSLTTPRFQGAATLLNSGNVLVAGGESGICAPDTASAELYDPTTGMFTATGSMSSGRGHETATVLGNGKVLVAGGTTGPTTTSSADLYDAATGTFNATASMITPRDGHTATLLGNGQVLVAGGENYPVLPTQSSAELYDPVAGTFTATGSMTTDRTRHTATLLNNGQVLVTGGVSSTGVLTSAELYQSTPAATSTTIVSSNSPSIVNQSVTLTATVTPSSGTGTPTGTVTFKDTSTSTTLGTQTLSSGQATLTTSSLAVGNHNITAQYSGDSNFQASSGSLAQTVEYGLCLLYDQTRAVHSGAVIPIKLELCDANGNNLSTSSIIVHATGVVLVSTNTPGTLESPGNANPDNDFRFDSTLGSGGGYIFNLSTGALGMGTYNLQFTAGNDPTMHAAQFEVK